MRKIIVVLTSLLAFIFLVGCEKSEGIVQNVCPMDGTQNTLQLAQEYAGGCNSSSLKSNPDDMFESDTVIVSMEGEFLNLFVGKQYSCCIDFSASHEIAKDSVSIIITKEQSEESSACRCMCYYTWDFNFDGFSQGEYTFKVFFDDGMNEEPQLMGEPITMVIIE